MYFYDMNTILYRQKREGVQVKAVSGERIQMLFTKLEPGFTSFHSHPHEQMGCVLSGELEITIGDETRRCGAGISYAIPGNMPHGFKVLSDQPSEILDIFSPPKDENRL